MSSTRSQTEGASVARASTVSRGIGARDPELATRYMNRENFIQHNLHCADGVPGFEEFLAVLGTEPSPLHMVRAFQDGPYVVTHSEGDVFGPKVFFDIFRFEAGLIVEHWDNLTEMTGPNASNHTPIDGPSEPTDLEATEASKSLVRDFFETVFMYGDPGALEDYFTGDALVQHHAGGEDGVSALSGLLQSQADAGRSFEVEKIEQVLGQGSFVLITLSGRVAGVPTALYDLFRIQDGKIAEHWDVAQPILPEDEWKNCNGKF